MSAALIAGLRQAVGLFLTGLVLKLLDDHLDAGEDEDYRSPAARLGTATTPYLLAGLCVAALADPAGALPVFAAGYAVGMAHESNRRLPSGLSPAAEGGLLLGTVALLAGPTAVVWGLALLWSVQATDDYLDRVADQRSGKPTLVTRLGAAETVVLAAAAGILACALDPLRTALAVAVFTVLQMVERRWRRAA